MLRGIIESTDKVYEISYLCPKCDAQDTYNAIGPEGVDIRVDCYNCTEPLLLTFSHMDYDPEDIKPTTQAEHIVKCVNAHEELMEFVKYCKQYYNRGADIDFKSHQLLKKYGE